MRFKALVYLIFISSNLLFSSDPTTITDTLNAVKDTVTFVQSNPDSILIEDANKAYAKEILQKYITVIGGEIAIREIEDRITDMKGTVQGIETEIMFYQKAPNKLCQVIMVGEVVQKIIFDGVQGIKIIGDEKQQIMDEELVKLQYDAEMNLVLNPESFDIDLFYKGLENINNRDCYKLLLTLPNKTEWLQFYDMHSGLKVRDSKDIITPAGKFQQITEFDDYRYVNGILYPFKIKQYLGNHVLDFIVESIRVNTGVDDSIFQID